jgi:hypothetical protein
LHLGHAELAPRLLDDPDPVQEHHGQGQAFPTLKLSARRYP